MARSPTDELEGVRSGYDQWSEIYDHDQNPLPAMEERYVREAVGKVNGQTVLDLGCGTGRHAVWLADSGASVTAVDFSEGMLREARRKAGAERIKFVAHDLHQRLPFPDASFDLVVSGLVLEHLRDLSSFFREVRRVLRPGSRAIVSSMHPAMFLRGGQARFTAPSSGVVIAPGSLRHTFGDLIMASVSASLLLAAIGEYSPDETFVERFPRAEKYLGWPMLVVFQLRAASSAKTEGM